MMTGTYPSTHGSGSYNETLPESIPTVAERLADAGYRTVGVSSNPYFSATTGTERGFDRFDLVSGKELAMEAGMSGLVSFIRNVRTFSGGLEIQKQKHRPDFLLNEIVKDRLEACSKRDNPFFLAAHYQGAHHPYYPSPAFRDAFASDLSVSPDRAAEIAFDSTTEVYSQIARGSPRHEDREKVIKAMYDAQVAQTDALVDRLLSFVESLGLGNDTIVVITSDHGDLLGEMDLFSHKLVLHDALIRVPIAVRGSEYLTDADLGMAQHADIMQTILSELDVDTEGMRGQRLDRAPRDVAVAQRGAETYRKTVDEVKKHDPDFDHEHVLAGFVTALRAEKWKYVSGDDDAVLYELPTEDEDVSSEYPEVANEFETRLEEWMNDHGDLVVSDSEAEFSEAVQEQLADLGYLE